MIRLLHISDVHLGARLSGFGASAADRSRAIRDAFRGLPARAGEWSIDAVLVAGDLFDTARPDSADVDVAREVLRALAGDGRPVFVIPGNHDPAVGADSPWRAMPEVVTTILAPRFEDPVRIRLREETLSVYGLAYDPVVEADPLDGYRRADGDGFHVVLLHAGTADNPDWTGGRGLRTTSERIARLDADYVALGDHHAFRPPREFGGRACYPGSFAAVATDETGPRGCVVVELEAGAPPRVRLEPSPVPELLDLGRVDVSDASDELDVAERLGALASDAGSRASTAVSSADSPAREAGVHPVAELVGEPGFPLDADRVLEAVQERFGFAVVHDETRFFDSAHVEELAGQPTVGGHVARLGRERAEVAEDGDGRAVAERALRLALRALEAS